MASCAFVSVVISHYDLVGVNKKCMDLYGWLYMFLKKIKCNIKNIKWRQ